MPRGRKKGSVVKKLTSNEKIEALKKTLEDKQAEIEKIKTQIEEAEKAAIEKEKNDIYNAFVASGKTLEEVLNFLAVKAEPAIVEIEVNTGNAEEKAEATPETAEAKTE